MFHRGQVSIENCFSEFQGSRTMKRKTVQMVVSMLAIAMFAAPIASASNVHLKGGSHAVPAFTDNGLTLTGSGELAGLGNEDVLVTLAGTANPTGTCGNPGS